ncbi:phage tail assembly chaperone [Lysobacter enzymogenes]|uniref:phage tail assembly chaperone n=1 Tax=Lysobacter enzymogenes TaxID=69 RepID=UPI001A971789|nr:phage tail assembly chaperone [Lysobacter enzymogenes]QQP97936.1 hypothetical protein JHW38_08015 [Lysobacter enzymogenes]
MAKLSLNPSPTFDQVVKIPVPAGEAPVKCTFKHRGRKELQVFLEDIKGMTTEEVVRAVVLGWDLDDAFTPENVERLCNEYPGAGAAIFNTYIVEASGARKGN